MKTIECFAPVISALQRQQQIMTRRLFAMGLALAGAVLLALPAAGQAQSAPQTESFELEGTWFLTNKQFGVFQIDTTHAARLWEGTVIGDSTLGSFSGTYAEIGTRTWRVGSGTCEFRRGSLTFEYQYEWEPPTISPSIWTGTYVVCCGTGLFEGATGEGIIIVEVPGESPTGPFFLSGTLSR